MPYVVQARPERSGPFDHHSDDKPDPTISFQTTVTFGGAGSKARAAQRALPTATTRAAALKFGAIEGGSERLARLGGDPAATKSRG